MIASLLATTALAAALLSGSSAATHQAAGAATYVNDGRCYNGLGQNEGFIPVGYEQVPTCGSIYAPWPVRNCYQAGPWTALDNGYGVLTWGNWTPYTTPQGTTMYGSLQLCQHS